MDRKNFLKISSGTFASVWASHLLGASRIQKYLIDFGGQNKEPLAKLIVLDAEPPLATTAVRYFIDEMQVAELTDAYAQSTMTKPCWKTLIDPRWFEPGERNLRIEADCPDGKKVLQQTKLHIPLHEADKGIIPLSGAWAFSNAADLPAGVADGAYPAVAHPGFDTGSWARISVPHALGYSDKKWNVYEGILGVYHKKIALEVPAKGEQLAIVLQSCYWAGRVFINGKACGETVGGYLPDRFDITDAVKAGDNDIVIITDNRFTTMGVFKRINAFYWNWGGLVQELWIERNKDVALTQLRASGSQSGKLLLWFTSVNKTANVQSKTVAIDVVDPGGKKVLSKKDVTLKLPGGGGILEPVELSINRPVLWNLEEPNLYTVIVRSGEQTINERTGFRDVTTSGPDLLINGRPIQGLQGFDRHADYPGLGRTQPDRLPYDDLKELYDKGFRIFRPAHYPTTPAQLDAADSLGMLVIEEINVTGLKGAQLASQEVKDFGARQLTRMIERDRSHPCIIAWSVGNENLTEEEGAAEYIRDTIQIGRSLDKTRLFTHVTMRGVKDKTFEYQDFVAQNYYAGWYTKEVNAIAGLLDDIQKYSGNKPLLVTEYGAEAVIGREGTGKGTEFYQSFIVDEHNRLLDQRPHFIGKLYWASAEFWCRPDWTGGNPEPIPPFHVKGLMGYHRNYNKLAWRVMFSPLRLSLAGPVIQKTAFGGEIHLDKSTEAFEVKAEVLVSEIKGKPVSGTLKLLTPDGFKATKTNFPFKLPAGGSSRIAVSFKGNFPLDVTSINGFVHAVIDADTEAQPLLLTLLQKQG